MAEVSMPRLSDTMSEGTIGRWLKEPGDRVEKGEILVEIETDKATMELEAYESGFLQEILVQAGETVPIGQAIAVIGDSANGASAAEPAQPESAPAPAAPAPQATPATGGNGQQAPAQHATPPPATDGERVKASPLARRIATDYGIDLRQVQGTGPGGRIIRENVESFYQQGGAAQPASAPAPATPPRPAATHDTMPLHPPTATPTPLNRMRRAIAHRMSESKNGTPHFYITSEIDMAEILKLRKELNDHEAAPVKISVNDFIIKAMARTLRAYPVLNSSYMLDEAGHPAVVQHEHVNISVAISVDDGLIVPVVVDADQKGLGTIAAEVKDMAARAREGKIKQNELEGGTFTVSNLGMFDVTEFIAIITPPQAGVLAIGSVRQVPIVHHDQITVGDIMSVTLSADHRVVDGAVAAKCLHHFKRLMQSPYKLLV